MITNYEEPHLEIEQNLQVLPDPLPQRFNPVVFGPQYKLARYGEEVTDAVAFALSGELNYVDPDTAANLLLTSFTVDQDYVKVYGEDLLLLLADLTSGWAVESASELNKIRGAEIVKGTLLDTDFSDRDLSVGDYALVGTTLRRITGFLGEESAAVVGTPAAAAHNTGPAASILSIGGTYVGTADTVYTLYVKTGGASPVVTVYDSAGLETPVDVSVTDDTAFDMGALGLTATFDWTAPDTLETGDAYTIAVTAASESTSSFDGVILDGPVAADMTAVKFVSKYSGLIPATEYTVAADKVTLGASVSVPVSGRTDDAVALNSYGEVAVEYRALVIPAADQEPIAISSTNHVAQLGTVHPDNLLSYGVSRARAGLGGGVVYALPTSGTTQAAFEAALDVLSRSSVVYTLVPLTDDNTIKGLVSQHVADMSAADVMKFRRAYVGTDSPGEYTLDTAPVSIASDGEANLLLTVTDDSLVLTGNISAGDKVSVLDTEYEVDSVLNDTQLLLVSGPEYPVAAAQGTFIKTDTAANQAAYVKNVSQSLSNRRTVNVWCENGTALVGATYQRVSNMFAACEIAGMRCQVLPQQGLTRSEITTIASCPAMYTRYDAALLNEVAAAGTFILAQKYAGGPVLIRHQLTTETRYGSLYYEDSVGVNVDDIAFKVFDIADPFIGKKNANKTSISALENAIQALLEDATQAGPDEMDIGPQLESYEDLSVALDDTFKDTINISATLVVALPIGKIKVALNVRVSE